MRLPRILALGASIVLLVSACSAGGGQNVQGATNAPNVTIKMGSDGFYESQIMAEIYAQALEAKGYKIDRSGMGLGTRKVTAAALESGKIDIKPEYVGSGLAFYSPGKATGDPAANSSALQQVLTAKGITVLNFSPAADQNAFVVTQATATKYNLSDLAQVAAIKPPLKFGVATDCSTNPVCAPALKSAYGIDVSSALALSACDQPMVDAIKAGTVQVGELCSTQPDIAQNHWVVLADSKHTQPADNIAPLVRNSLLSQVDKNSFEAVLNAVSAKMTTDELTKLNAEYVFQKMDIPTIAKQWLSSVNLG